MMLMGCQLDGTFRMHAGGENVAQAAMTGTFSQYTVVSEWGCIKIPDDIGFAEAALVGCGVPTGWGSAVVACGVRPGDVHIVMGVGGRDVAVKWSDIEFQRDGKSVLLTTSLSKDALKAMPDYKNQRRQPESAAAMPTRSVPPANAPATNR